MFPRYYSYLHSYLCNRSLVTQSMLLVTKELTLSMVVNKLAQTKCVSVSVIINPITALQQCTKKMVIRCEEQKPNLQYCTVLCCRTFCCVFYSYFWLIPSYEQHVLRYFDTVRYLVVYLTASNIWVHSMMYIVILLLCVCSSKETFSYDWLAIFKILRAVFKT